MSKRINVRHLRLRDMDRVLEIEQASFGAEAYDRNLFAEYFHKCGELFLVADLGERICGYSLTCISGQRAELVSVAVDPPDRGKGIARTLLDSTLRRLRRRAVARLALTVRQSNQPARALYESQGFLERRIIPGYYEDGEDGLMMTKEVG